MQVGESIRFYSDSDQLSVCVGRNCTLIVEGDGEERRVAVVEDSGLEGDGGVDE